MKRFTRVILFTIALLIIGVVIVGLQVRHQQTETETAGSITLKSGGQELLIPVSDLDREAFSGETVNGKGEHFNNDYRGVELQNLLSEQGLSPDSIHEVTALAADQYSAVYSGEEICESGRIYLAVEVNGEAIEGIEGDRPGVQVIVFGDPDSRRMVRSLEILEIK